MNKTSMPSALSRTKTKVRYITSIFFIIIGTGLLLSFTPGKDASDQRLNAATVYVDGVYKGEGRGFRPRLKVEVEILGGKIERIKVVSHNEIGPQYWRRAIKAIPNAIIKTQSTNVDVVGGATYTSRGIIDAVEDALKAARAKSVNSTK